MVTYQPAGDRGIVVEFENVIDPGVNRKVRAMAQALGQSGLPGFLEAVPTYRSLLVVYDPLVAGYGQILDKLQAVETQLDDIQLPEPARVLIPTVYGDEFGPDLAYVAQYTGLSPDEVVRIHSEPWYLIYMLGFLAGYPYLGGMSPQIVVPRLEKPHLRIAAGSVGIGGSQTGIYPIESPGGWRIIGRTPLRLFNPRSSEPVLLRTGDLLRFVPITRDEYQKAKEEIL